MADTRKAEQETIEGARAAKQREMKDLQKKLVTETDGISIYLIIFIFTLTKLYNNLFSPLVNWLKTDQTLREQNIGESDQLLMLRKFFYDDVKVNKE